MIWIPAAIAAAASLAGLWAQSRANKSAATTAFERQKDLMLSQYGLNQDAVREMNAYNDPSAQMSRLKSAGLNPNLVYGDATLSSLQSSPASVGSAPSAPMANVPDYGASLSTASDIALKAAQVKKLGSETVGQSLENDYLQKTMEERIRQVAVNNGWTEEQTAKASQEVSMIVAQQNALRETIEKTKADTAFTNKQTEWYERHMKAEIAHLTASSEYQRATKDMTLAQKKLLDECFDSYTRIATASADQMEKAVQLLGRYGDAQAVIGMLSQVVSSASDILGVLKPKLTIHK